MSTPLTQRRPINGYGDLPVTSTSPPPMPAAYQEKKKKARNGNGSNGNHHHRHRGAAPKGKKYPGSNWPLKLIGFNLALVAVYVLYQKWRVRGVSQMEPIYRFLGGAPRALNEDYVVIVSAATGSPEQTHVRVGRSNVSALEALRRASNHLPLHHSYPYMKIDYVTGVRRIEDFDYFEPFEDDIGDWFGIALNWTDSMVFLPDQVRAHSLVDRARYLRWERIVAWIQDHFPKRVLSVVPDLSDDESQLPTIDLFHTHSIFVDLKGKFPQAIPLYMGHRMFQPSDLTPHMLREAAIGVGKYLMQNEDGILAYFYQPRSDFTEDTDHPNLFQGHAAAIYSLAALYRTWQDPGLLQATEDAISFIVQKLVPCKMPFAKGLGKCIAVEEDEEEDGEVSLLGMNSVLLLSLAEYTDATGGGKKYVKEAFEIAKWIAGCQPDSKDTEKPHGSFAQKVTLDPLGAVDEYTEIYAESQAVFAMARFVNVMEKYHYTYRQEWKEVAFSGITYMVGEAQKLSDDYNSDPYLLHAIAELTRFHDADLQRMLEYSIRCSELASKYQILESSDKRADYVGSLVDDPSVTASAALSDGLCAVFQTLLLHDRKEEAHKVLDSALLSVAYQLQSQYHPETAMYMSDPNRIIGGMHQSPDHMDMAIYDSQHNLGSFLCVAEALEYKRRSGVTW